MNKESRWILQYGEKSFPVTGPTTVGRTMGQIQFPEDHEVSHEHCLFRTNENGLTVRDLGSTNGTFVSGNRISPNEDVPIQKATEVRIGSQVIHCRPPQMHLAPPDPELAELFELIREDSETILWAGQPLFFPFVFLRSGVAGTLFMIFFFSIPGIVIYSANPNSPTPMYLYGAAIAALAVFSYLLRIFSYRLTAYAFTNKRVITRSGIFVPEFDLDDYDQIKDLMVRMGIMDMICGTGTIFIEGPSRSLEGIAEPYEVLKILKQISVDVKTDWYYPNALRPDTNEGIKTKYRP